MYKIIFPYNQSRVQSLTLYCESWKYYKSNVILNKEVFTIFKLFFYFICLCIHKHGFHSTIFTPVNDIFSSYSTLITLSCPCSYSRAPRKSSSCLQLSSFLHSFFSSISLIRITFMSEGLFTGV